ncbi:natural resistance-associated macrophage protein [Kordia sp. SMS9]|uniref:Nramp family divalent metal transporter n=1 Tax=Kordia sp. SMS9 TaxID=2282170 RepID=UPI000E0DF377|nr:Nramp family divalent metal transporter [Kordia sp. SMS9]AXG70050.1 natural resistance-associated macrophage protein [Kordia sp. SMS9]
MKLAFIKKLGPGLLFAGAAIGVSHLVNSTQVGAEFGFGLLWVLLLVNLFKYPFFQFGPRYATATGESLLDGYKKLSKGLLIAYFVLSFATMFTIQTAVTIVTAGLAEQLFGIDFSMATWSTIITLICLGILTMGRYSFLDKLMKVIIVTLTISTVIAVTMAIFNGNDALSAGQIFPTETGGITLLIVFMGWMPAPLDISIFHSLWAIEKRQETENFTPKSALFDFNFGYIITIVLGICFMALGALIMFNSGLEFSSKGGEFASQLINLYTESLSSEVYIIIAIAAFTTMFSTTLTTLDASPRAMAKTSQLLFGKYIKHSYIFWMLILVVGTIIIMTQFLAEMGSLIYIATVLSFVTAPFYAISNYILITSKHTPAAWQPKLGLRILSWLGIIFLTGFSVWYLFTL